jgi:hypothetical protein
MTIDIGSEQARVGSHVLSHRKCYYCTRGNYGDYAGRYCSSNWSGITEVYHSSAQSDTRPEIIQGHNLKSSPPVGCGDPTLNRETLVDAIVIKQTSETKLA